MFLDFSNLLKSLPNVLASLHRDERGIAGLHEAVSLFSAKITTMKDLNCSMSSGSKHDIREKLLVLNEVHEFVLEWFRLCKKGF